MSDNTKNYYEGMFITRSGGGEEAWEQSRTAVTDILEDHGATIDYIENWADQQFEVEIENERRGKYVLIYFQADPSRISEVKRATDLEDRILRELILNREREDTYQELIQKRIEAQKEEEEEEEEEQEDEEEKEDEVEGDAAEEESDREDAEEAETDETDADEEDESERDETEEEPVAEEQDEEDDPDEDAETEAETVEPEEEEAEHTGEIEEDVSEPKQEKAGIEDA